MALGVDPVSKINFWRTRNGAEIDFVVSNAGKVDRAIEVKARELKRGEVPDSFRGFFEEYHPKLAMIVNLALDLEVEYHGVTVRFVRFDFRQFFKGI